MEQEFPVYTPRPGKFVIPSRLPDLLRRQRLLDFLHGNIHRKLLLIVAAAGYGKSSMLIDFAHDTDYPVAWFQMDSGDADLATFVVGLAAAFHKSFSSFESIVPAMAARQGAQADELANAFNRELESMIDEYSVIVLDDFHLVENSPQIIAFMDALLAATPEQVHFVVSSRTLPELSVIALAAHQQAAGLNEERLRFTGEEVRQLVQMRRNEVLSDTEAEGIVSNTEGWITGILLTTELMWQGILPDLLKARTSESPVYDFLVDEVLVSQPPMLRQFLMESAVMPEMDPRTCNDVLGRTDSGVLLREAESRHLFVSAVGDEHRTYRYHHLFRDFLLARLQSVDPARLLSLYERAAEWYAGHDMPEAAVTFFVAAGQTREAASIAERHAKRVYEAGRFKVLQNWIEQLSAVVDEIPRVCLYLAKLQMDTNAGEARRAYDVAVRGFSLRGDMAGVLASDLTQAGWMLDNGETGTCLALVEECVARARTLNQTGEEATALRLIGLCQMARGEMDKAEEAFRTAIQTLRNTSQMFNLAAILGDLAYLLRARGQTTRSAQIQQEALSLWRMVGMPGQLAMALNNTGYDLHMLGQYENAYATFKEALGWARRSGNVRSEVYVLLSQGDLLSDIGDAAPASDLYSQALAKAERLGDKTLVAYLYRGMVRLNRAVANYSAALEWLRRAEIIAGHMRIPFLNLEGQRGIVLIELGRIAEGREALERACAHLADSAAMSDQAQNFLLLAYAQFRDGDTGKAALSLQQSFAMAERIGYDQMLVTEALSILEMLEFFVQHPIVGRPSISLLTRAKNLRNVRERVIEAGTGPLAGQPAALEVRALGQGRIFRNGVEISASDWKYPRLREIFLFIVDHAPLERETLLATFWPDKPRMRASANLRQSLYLMRRVLSYDAVVIVGDECQLAQDVSIGYDVASFEASARTAMELAPGDLRRLGALTAAAALFTGEYLADMISEWVIGRRQVLAATGIKVLKEYADELMNLTRYGEARKVLDRALGFEPMRDDLHEQMLICLAQMGLRHEVVSHYLNYQDHLRAELGLDPPPEIRALYSRLIS
jgi:ATP/maltotriose-dependent transcriptional regulator MalT/DNA-binding SARP family transcriptional activator